MSSPRVGLSPAAMSAGRSDQRSPRSRAAEASAMAMAANGGSASKDEAIWKRLSEAGFDEETVTRRDKAALIAYITKLESELYDYQYNMGLLITEKKEWMSKYEQLKASADLAEMTHKQDKASFASVLAEAKKQEETLKRKLAIEQECVTNIEKALHDIRAESAETKLAYESKMAEARKLMETAQRKLEEADNKLHSAESLQAEASRTHNTALRNLQDVEAREDELRRRLNSFLSECDAKEKELSLQRQSLYDSQRLLHQEQERLQEGRTLLNQREDYIFGKLKELSRLEEEVDEAKSKLEEDRRNIKEKISSLDLDAAALATREEATIERESQLDSRECELLILQEKISRKEYDELQRLAAEHESSLQRRKLEFEEELQKRRKSFEDEMEARETAYKDRETELIQRESLVKEEENSLKVQLKAISEKQENLAKELKLLEDKERNLISNEKSIELEMVNMQKERQEMKKVQEEIEKAKESLEDQRKAALREQEKLELSIQERNELFVWESKLKEEIDSLRSKKIELDAEADKLRAEKEEFETEWELIDGKREELRKEAKRVAEERKAISTYLKNEHDSIRLEKDNFRNQLKTEAESLSREREEFMSKMEWEHSEWIIKIQRERDDFVKDINIQRKEMEKDIVKRREEVEIYLKDREEAFEQEKAKELQLINSQKEMISKQLQHVSSELKRLDNERMEIALDREQRQREWSEIKSSIGVLNIQREKLQKQRELLHADREDINQKIQHLNKLEHLNIESESRAMLEVHSRQLQLRKAKSAIRKCNNTTPDAPSDNQREPKLSGNVGVTLTHTDTGSPPLLATVSLVKKYAKAMFRLSPEKGCADQETENSVDGDMAGTNAIPNKSLCDKSSGKIPEAEYKNCADKLSLKKSDKNVATKGTPSSLNGRKRLNDMSPGNSELNQIHKKARSGSGAVAEKSPNSIHENGGSRDSENPLLVGNATTPLTSTVNHDMLNTQKQDIGRPFSGFSQPADNIAAPAIHRSNGGYVEGDVYTHVIDEDDVAEETDDEAGETKTSRLQKLWFFLTT